MKKCPSCAEAIQRDAKRCRFCGAALRRAPVSGAIFAIAGAMVAIAIYRHASIEPRCHSAALPTTPVVAQRADRARASVVDVTAAQLHADYRASALAAAQRYRGRTLRVTGKAIAVNLAFADAPYMALETTDAFEAVHAHFASGDALAQVAPGQAVTLRCIGDDAVMGSPVLRRCVVE